MKNRYLSLLLSVVLASYSIHAQTPRDISRHRIKSAVVTTHDSQKNNKEHIVTTTYYKNGAPKEIKEYFDGTLINHEILTYNKKGDITKSVTLDSLGNIVKKTINLYYKFHKISEEVKYENDVIIRQTYYDYDKNKNKITETIYEKRQMTKRTTYRYNPKNVLIERTATDAQGNILHHQTYQYTY
jgi:hypothetical protein